MENNISNRQPLLTDTQQGKKISTFGNVWRTGLLWLTCPIWATLRATKKTVTYLLNYSALPFANFLPQRSTYAYLVDTGYVQGKWYDKGWFLRVRRIGFLADWALHIAYAAVTAPFKFLKSFVMSFRTGYRITKDICSDKSNEFFYSVNGGGGRFLYMVQQSNNGIELKKFGGNRELKTKCWPESTMPMVKLTTKENDKSAWAHFKALLGFKSIKDKEEDRSKYFEWDNKGSLIERGQKILEQYQTVAPLNVRTGKFVPFEQIQ